jgi:hypothetical protein
MLVVASVMLLICTPFAAHGQASCIPMIMLISLQFTNWPNIRLNRLQVVSLLWTGGVNKNIH